jgi:serine/threonine-protein kinase
MAPEQADSTMRVDQRADIYAWGVVAYELLVGRHPFADSANAREFVVAHVSEMPPPLRRKHRLIEATLGEKPQPLGIVASEVPSALVKLVMRCLEKDPARRPQEASELLEVLEDANATLLARHRRRALRSRSLVVASAVLATALLVTGALSSRTRTAGRPTTRDTAAVAAVDRGLGTEHRPTRIRQGAGSA